MSYITDPKGAQFSLFTIDNNTGDQTMLGQKFYLEDGREVALILNASAGAIAAARVVQHAPIVAADQALVTTAYSPVNVQTNLPATVTVTSGGAVLANQYALGYAVVTAGLGIGQTLQISSNSAATGSSQAIVVTLADAPVVALDATSVINLIAQPYSNVVVSPTTHTAATAGVTLYALPATTGTLGTSSYVPSYGFIVTRGLTAALSDVTIAAVGLGIAPSVTTAGTVTLAAATTARIGQAYQTGISAQAGLILVNL